MQNFQVAEKCSKIAASQMGLKNVRTGLKILRWQHHTGSIPVFGTKGFRIYSETYFYALAPVLAPDMPFFFKTLFSLFADSLSISSNTC